MALLLENRGMTLIEQMIALGLGAVMMTGLFSYFRSEVISFALPRNADYHDGRCAGCARHHNS